MSDQEEISSKPFDPRTDVSADAKHIANHIVMHLWIIFIVVPAVLGIFYLLSPKP